MFGPEAIFAAIIAKALASFLEVDPKAIEMSLLAHEKKRLVLPNAKLRTRRLRVSSVDESSTFLVLSGSIDEIVVSWSWSSSLCTVEKSIVSLKGVRLEGHYELEKAKSNKETRHESPSYFQEIYTDSIQAIKNSEKFQQTLRDLVETLSIAVTDLQFRLNLPNAEAEATINLASKKTELIVILESLRLESQVTSGLGAATTSLRGPWSMDVSIISLSLQAIMGHQTAPILESFTHVATIRKVAGVQFSTLASGYEFIGREYRSHEIAMEHASSEGIIIHLSTISMSVVRQVVSLFRNKEDINLGCKGDSLQGNDAFRDRALAGRKSWSANFTSIMLRGMALIVLFFFSWMASETTKSFIIWLAIASLSCVLLGCWLFVRLKAFLVRKRVLPKTKPKSDEIALFRVPLPFISVVGPMGVSATLSKIALLGRLDWNMIKISADSFSCQGSEEDHVPARVSATGIRLSLKPDVLLLNVDSISELYHPRHVNLCQPLMYTAIRFEKGVVTTKMKALHLQMLPRASANATDDSQNSFSELGQRVGSFVEDTRRRIGVTGRQINDIPRRVRTGMQHVGGFADTAFNSLEPNEKELANEASRAKLNSHLFARVMILKTVAIMFEAIPLSRNRNRFRLYPDTFRGNHAVDYLLKCKVAATRLEAKKVLRDLQIQFRLFEHVTRECNFRDDHDAIFHFVDKERRRMWECNLVPFKYTEAEVEERTPSDLPFPVTVLLQEFFLRNSSDMEPFLCLHGTEIFIEPSRLSRGHEINAYVASFETKMVSATNARVRTIIDPDLPQDLHGLELSTDSVQASPGHTTEDWYEWLELATPAQNSSEATKTKQDAIPFLLPYMYIAPFKLRLSWKGVVFATKETSIAINAFSGDEKATSNDLINFFVMQVLSCAPGLLANFRIFGVNVMEQSGIVSALTVGAKFVPFGQFLAIGGIALIDGVTLALDRGKAARSDSSGKHRIGDFYRGIVCSAQEAAISGARTRGKVDENFYDDDDEVTLDPLDFAVGVASETANYIYSNKARFAGATVAGASVVALTVATGPIAGIILGVVCGIATESAVRVAENKFEKTSDDSLRHEENQ